LGKAITKHGCCLLTGACPGLPHAAVLGAKDAGGHVIGISPATTLKEHVEVHASPYAEYDLLIFTGLGLMGRELINIRSSDIVVIVGGRCGTRSPFPIRHSTTFRTENTNKAGMRLAMPRNRRIALAKNPFEYSRIALSRRQRKSWVAKTYLFWRTFSVRTEDLEEADRLLVFSVPLVVMGRFEKESKSKELRTGVTDGGWVNPAGRSPAP
jgi:uncharacterized protein (TIGR00725 family)